MISFTNKRKRGSGAALAGIFSAMLLAGSIEAAPPQQPNIIFIFSDDHAYQAISAYSDHLLETPNIDRIANEGARFENCLVTNSICGPSRAAILTGKYSHANGFYRNGNKFDGNQWTFPKSLQEAGYETAVIGKWHLGTHMAPTGFDYSSVLVGQGEYYNPRFLVDENGDGERDQVRITGYTTDLITDQTLEWLEEKRDPDKPFMLMTQHKAPHRPWMPALRHLDYLEDVTVPAPGTLFDDYGNRPRAVAQQDMTIASTMNNLDLKLQRMPWLNDEQREKWNAHYGPLNEEFQAANLDGQALTLWKYQRYIKDYLRCIKAVDENVGRLLDYLDEEGLAENTLIIYSSDQGFYLGEHGWFDKRWAYEESLQTPFAARWPGVIEPNTVVNDLVSVIDFAPTFLEMAGAEVPDNLHGQSLLPIFNGNTPSDWRSSFYYHYYEYPGWHAVRKHYAVIQERYKLIHFYERDHDTWHLVDLKMDPNEMYNFYDNSEYAEIRKDLHEELERLRNELDVPEDDPVESLPGINKY